MYRWKGHTSWTACKDNDVPDVSMFWFDVSPKAKGQLLIRCAAIVSRVLRLWQQYASFDSLLFPCWLSGRWERVDCLWLVKRLLFYTCVALAVDTSCFMQFYGNGMVTRVVHVLTRRSCPERGKASRPKIDFHLYVNTDLVEKVQCF